MRLNELDKDEWFLLMKAACHLEAVRGKRAELTMEEYDAAWDDFVALKKRMKMH